MGEQLSPTILPQPAPVETATAPANALETLALADQVGDLSDDESFDHNPIIEEILSAATAHSNHRPHLLNDNPLRFTVADAPFHTTLIDLACPTHLLPAGAVDTSDPLILHRIDRVHVHVPRPTTGTQSVANGVIAVSANWAQQSRIGQTPTSKDVTRIIHVLDATTFAPISSHILEKDTRGTSVSDPDEQDDEDEPQLRSLQAVDAVNKAFVVMSYVDNDPEHGAFVASMLQLVSYDSVRSGADKVVATHTFPGAPDSASLPIQIHNDNTYKLIYTDATSNHFTIRHLHAPTLTLARPDVIIRTTDLIHHYEPDFPSILVTGDQFGAIRVWCTATGTLKYAYQVAHMLTNSFAMLRPLIPPWIIDTPHVWARDKWVQVYSLVCGFEWDAEEQPGASLHSVVSAHKQVPPTIAEDDPLYEQPDWPRFMRLFEEKRDGLAWMGSFASLRGLASVEEAPRPMCLYRDRSRGNYVAFLAAYQALFAMDDQGRLMVTDLVGKDELGSLVAAGCTAKQAIQVIKADSKQDQGVLDLKELVAPDGHVGCAVLKLHKSAIKPRPGQWPSTTAPEDSTHLSGDMMFLGSDWNRFLVYRNSSLMVLEQC
ncbi:hypothetical protein BCR44DRAFT_59890 [Catenaria anguillulae PL171]|uniref:Uncharacterized protein n=1 Tax=Catenaria anguillulae PL171 TaxID=765915 RepID=A0A1Y2HNC2_9FUNG|nr:hypothetical protein BCR44DRAFT_59890 [Catenaria anguillulae PL171]